MLRNNTFTANECLTALAEVLSLLLRMHKTKFIQHVFLILFDSLALLGSWVWISSSLAVDRGTNATELVILFVVDVIYPN